MKYILGVGLEFNWYKGKTNIRLFSDDTFIDEIVLDNHVHLTEKKRITLASYDPVNKKTNWVFSKNTPYTLPNKLFLFEIDESCLGEKISFRMNDNNTNYTNGFLTKSNLVKFHTIFLMPKCSLKKENYTKLLKFLHKRFKKYDPYEDKEYESYGPWKAFCMDWPGTYVLYNSNDKNVHLNWIGGHSTCYVNLRKKFNVHQIWPGETTNADYPTVQGIPRLFFNYIHHYNLLNIYDEDQRSNRTKD